LEPEDGVVSPPRRAPRMTPLPGPDVAEARAAPAPAPGAESLDPDLPPRSDLELAEAHPEPAPQTAPSEPEVWGGSRSAESVAATDPAASVPDWEIPAPPGVAGKEADASNGALQLAANEPAAEPFPGDEPTRVEPVGAALIEKLRERDEEVAAQHGNAAAVTMQD